MLKKSNSFPPAEKQAQSCKEQGMCVLLIEKVLGQIIFIAQF
jgi:hypothetical protein